MHPARRTVRWSLVVSSLIAALLLSACAGQQAAAPAPQSSAQQPAAPAPAKPVPIRIGHGVAAEEQLWLMKARPDLTPGQGKVYTLEFTQFRGNADRMNAYQAGELDGGTISANTALFAGAQGLEFRAVASITRESDQGFKSTFLVRSDAGIEKVADLKGKTIGIVDYKSATDLWARAGLKKAGLDPERDVKLVVVPFPAMGDSLRTKKVDAGIFVQPFYSVELAKGGLKVLFDSKYGVPFEEELMLLFLRPQFIEKNRAVVKAFIDDYRKATRYFVEQTGDAKKALVEAKMVQTPLEAFQKQQDPYRSPDPKVDLAAMEKMMDMVVEVGWLQQKYDFKQFVDNGFHS